jgi:hypothetical protein
LRVLIVADEMLSNLEVVNDVANVLIFAVDTDRANVLIDPPRLLIYDVVNELMFPTCEAVLKVERLEM